MNDKPVIINIMNFVRALEPRDEEVDMFGTFRNESEELIKSGLPGSILLQHDALVERQYVDYIKANLIDEKYEIGAWWEFTQSLVERAGIVWRGRYSWDWHSDVGFSVGYTIEERLRLIDTYMSDFFNEFGRYPLSVGSWFIDAVSLKYMHEKYGVIASCNCRDQWGTDGYTMWGGYWNQAYYPSVHNSFIPAQNPEQQINVPIFRMLGSDPIYQYEASVGDNGQGVVTLEPAYPHGGGDPKWVRWFFNQMEQNPSLSFAYAQVGQENNFGWKRIKDGYIDQINFLKSIAGRKNIRIEKMCDSAEWFRRTFPVTPPAATIALEDWQDKGNSSLWYNCKNYRANLLTYKGGWRLRDIQLFNEKYAEPYLNSVATTNDIAYDALPVMDGFLWSHGDDAAGIYLLDDDGRKLELSGLPEVQKVDDTILRIISSLKRGDKFELTFLEDRIEFLGTGECDYQLHFNWPANIEKPIVNGDSLNYQHNGMQYSVRFINGAVKCRDGRLTVSPIGKTPIVMCILNQRPDPEKVKTFTRAEYPVKPTWIAPAGISSMQNCHFRVRAKVDRGAIASGELLIAAESFYSLYVNGKFVGCGPARGTYACNFLDRYDISAFLRQGENFIAAEVLCNNYPSFISHPSEPAIFIKAGNCTSDGSWQAMVADDWRLDVPKYTPQIGYMECRDMRKEPCGWMTFEDSTTWPTAHVIRSQNLNAKKLFLRDVEMLATTLLLPHAIPAQNSTPAMADMKASNVAEKINEEIFGEYSGTANARELCKGKAVTLEVQPQNRGTVIIADFGQGIVGGIELDVTAPSGSVVDICYEEVIENGKLIPSRNLYRVADRYILREGRQKITSPLHWRGARYVQFIFRNYDKPITVHQMAFADRRYPLTKQAEFESDDARMNELWKRCAATLSTCATDTLLDCPWREMSFWVNDFVVQHEFWHKLTGDDGLIKRCLSLALSQPNSEGFAPGVCPSDGRDELVLFPTNLFLPMILADFCMYSKDEKYVSAVLPEVEHIFNLCQKYADDAGLLTPPAKYWNFTDWSYWMVSGKGHYILNNRNTCIVNWFNVLASLSLAELYDSRDTSKAEYYGNYAEKCAESIIEKFWDPARGCFIETLDSDVPASKISHSLAIISGLLDDKMEQACLDAILGDDTLMPELYMMHYVFGALAMMERHDEILRLIEKFWMPMLDIDCPTIWEANVYEHGKPAFNNAGSMCHAFSLAPLSFIQKEILGIRPLENGYAKFLVAPHLNGMKHVRGMVPTILGDIEIQCKVSGGSMTVYLKVPQGTIAILPDGSEYGYGYHVIDIRQQGLCEKENRYLTV